MSIATALILALVLDAAFGEPKWLWSRLTHPAILMGRAVGALDSHLNQGRAKRLRGIIALTLLVLSAGTLGGLLTLLPGMWIDILLAAMLIAQRSLADHVRAVADALRLSLGDGRRAVAQIVGRDTTQMQSPAIARSAIESAAENLSDGIIAPAFWFLIGGLPGLLIYKVTNTADSMIGYRTPRHEHFGWAAARFDDLINLIPARLTALLIWLTAPRSGSYPAIRTDAKRHRSPNAGWPEAAMARALNIALSGPRVYDGQPVDYPFVNTNGKHDIGPDQIDAAVTVLWRAWALGLGACLLIAVL